MKKIAPDYVYFHPPAARISTLRVEGYASRQVREQILGGDFSRLVFREGDWKDIEFVLGIKDRLQHLSIQSKNFDWSILSEFKKLKTLWIGVEAERSISFKGFSILEELDLIWPKKDFRDESMFDLPFLRGVKISGWPYANLEKLKTLKTLVDISLAGGRAESLKGLECLTLLERISLSDLRKLIDCKPIKELNFIGELRIDKCKSIESYNFLREMTHIKDIDLLDSAAIDSLSVLDKFIRLENLRLGGTELKDGDLRRLAKLSSLKTCLFKDRAGYNIRREDLKALLLSHRKD